MAIKVEGTANSTLTITDTVSKNKYTLLRKDCEINLYYQLDMYDSNFLKDILVIIRNKYSNRIVASVDKNTLDSASTNYSADMATYYTNLITLLYA